MNHFRVALRGATSVLFFIPSIALAQPAPGSPSNAAPPDAARPNAGSAAAPPDAAPPDATNSPPAQSPADTTSAAPTQAAPEPLEVVVVGRSKPPIRGASDFVVHVGDLADVPRKNASQLLTLAPGILLTNEGGEGHAPQIFLRGFDTGEGQDIEFTVGGVPMNESGNLHGNGYADPLFIIPELIEGVRVIEGPFDPRQGNFAVAGSADYDLSLAKRGITAKYTFGSFGTHRALVLWGPPGASTRTFGGAEIYGSSGFGQNRDSKRASAIGQYEGRIGENGSFRVTAQAYANTYGTAGAIREDDYNAGRIGFYDSYDPRQGGQSSRYSIAGDIEMRSGDITYKQQVFAIYRGMRILENFTGFTLDPQLPSEAPHGQRGDLIDLDVTEATLGAHGSARLQGKLFGQKQELEIGYYARGDRVAGTESRLEAATGEPYHKDTDIESTLGDIGLYADVGLHPLPWLAIRGGARADLFMYDVLNRDTTSRASTADFAFMPRGSVILGPERGFSFSASAGRGVRSYDPADIVQDGKEPFASVVAYEGGVGYAGGGDVISIVAHSILFQTKVGRDLVFNEAEGKNVLGGAATRTGWALALRLSGDHFDVATNATLVRATYDDTGLAVPYVPSVLVRTDGSVFTEFPWEIRGERPRGALSLGLNYIGERPLPEKEMGDPVFTLDAGVTLNYSHYELGLSVTNLLNSQYHLSDYNFPSNWSPDAAPSPADVRHFTAGEPRAIFGTLGVNFGGS